MGIFGKRGAPTNRRGSVNRDVAFFLFLLTFMLSALAVRACLGPGDLKQSIQRVLESHHGDNESDDWVRPRGPGPLDHRP